MTETKSARLSDGRAIQYDILGDPAKPAVMPILGLTDNISDWPDSFCEAFLDAGFCVVRHELRDMGRSDQCEGRQYTMADIAQDVVELMDSVGIPRADLIGYSFGGAVAQIVALTEPKRVRSLVLLQSSTYNPDLPQRHSQVEVAMEATFQSYDSTQDEIDAICKLRLACGGSVHYMSHDEAMASAQRSVSRAYRPDGNRRLAEARKRTPPFYQRLTEIQNRTLILQATEDPIFPLGHGEDIALRINDSSLVYLHGAGHCHPESLRESMLAKIVQFLMPGLHGQSEMNAFYKSDIR